MQSLGQYIKKIEYKPFEVEDAEERMKKQKSLGLGNVSKYVAPKMLDANYENKVKANKLAEIFESVELKSPSYGDHELRPSEDIIILNGTAVPMFSVESSPDGYGSPNEWQEILHPQIKYINDLQAEHWGCEEANFTINPPKWAAAVFPKDQERAATITKIFMPMEDSLEKEAKEKDTKKLLKDLKGFDYGFIQEKKWELVWKRYFWVASLPEIPNTVLELAERARKISQGQFMLIYQPDWKIEKETVNRFDPILLIYQELERGGIWFKIAEWGGDYLEEVG